MPWLIERKLHGYAIPITVCGVFRDMQSYMIAERADSRSSAGPVEETWVKHLTDAEYNRIVAEIKEPAK